jgi:phosphate-selective porin OprO/OprP
VLRRQFVEGQLQHLRTAGHIGFSVILFAGVATAALAQPAATPAPDDRDARINQLEAEVQDLAAEVADLKRGQAAQIQTLSNVESSQPAKPTVVATIAGGRPTISSTDGQFTATLHTVMQLDAAQYDQASPGPLSTDFRRSGPALGASASNVDLTHARDLKAGDDFRRARIGVDGTVYGDWDYRFLLDFGGTGVENAGQIYETWVQYSGLKPFKFRVGAFPPSIGLDDQASTNGMPFLERTVVEDLARGFAAGDTRTAAQVLANGDNWLASAAVTGRVVGVINTGTAGAVPQSYGDQLGFVGRLAFNPLHGSDYLVHVGVHGSYVARPANASGPNALGVTPATDQVIAFANTQELRVDGTKLINTGNIDARNASTAGVEFAAQKSSLMLQAEYEAFHVSRDDPGLSSPGFHGYYVTGLWTLTGEPRRYNAQTAAFDAPNVAHPFNWSKGAWGAWEIGLRYSDIDLNYHAGAPGTAQPADGIRGGEEQDLSAALNWYPNQVVRFMFDYQHVRIDRLSPNAALYQTPAGAQIGQSYDAVAVRSQFAF